MSTYSEYNTVLTQKLGSRSEDFWEAAMRAQAINDAIREILDLYDLPEMIKVATITFDSSGIASIPDDYFRMADRPWSLDDNDKKQNVYDYIEPSDFDWLDSTASYFWTEDYIIDDAERKLKVKPVDSGTLYIRYIKEFTEVVTTSSTDSGLSLRWNEAMSSLAAARLLLNSGESKESTKADRLENLAFRLIPKKYTKIKNLGGWKDSKRVKSYYENHSVLNRYKVDNKVSL